MDLKTLKYRKLPAALLIFLTACTCHIPVSNRITATRIQDWISLYQHPLELHIAKPINNHNGDILVLYSTGDGGWRGLGEQIYEWIAAWDYPVVGFSSKEYLKNLGYVSDTTTPRRLVRDYQSIIQHAEQRLDMPPSTRIILVGLSRGAGLDVVAAGQGELQPNLGGLVAIALTKEEENVVHYRRSRHSSPSQPRRELVQIQTYEYLPRIESVPVVVIQSTNDDYLPASAARDLFGPDTELKTLLSISAGNHRFSGGCLELYKETEAALARIYKFVQAGNSVH
jgi:hypothetical protein